MKITVDREALRTVMGAAESYRDDLSSGLADGTYEEGVEELETLEAALETLDPMIFVGDGQYRRLTDCSPVDIERAKTMDSAVNEGKL